MVPVLTECPRFDSVAVAGGFRWVNFTGLARALILKRQSSGGQDQDRRAGRRGALHRAPGAAQRFLKEESFDAELIVISGPIANIALSSGDTEYLTGYRSALRAILQGLPLRIIALFRPMPHFMLQTRPEFKSVKNLKGRSIGVTTFGSGPELVGRIMIKHLGLDPDKDVKWVAAGSGEARWPECSKGCLTRPSRACLAITMVRRWAFPCWFVRKISSAIRSAASRFTVRKIKEKPDEVKRVIRAGIKANRYMRANRDGTIAVLMATYRIDKEAAGAAYDSFIKGFNTDGSMPEDGFRRLLDDTKRVMKIDREVALSEVSDLTILKEAQRELGIK